MHLSYIPSMSSAVYAGVMESCPQSVLFHGLMSSMQQASIQGQEQRAEKTKLYQASTCTPQHTRPSLQEHRQQMQRRLEWGTWNWEEYSEEFFRWGRGKEDYSKEMGLETVSLDPVSLDGFSRESGMEGDNQLCRSKHSQNGWQFKERLRVWSWSGKKQCSWIPIQCKSCGDGSRETAVQQ